MYKPFLLTSLMLLGCGEMIDSDNSGIAAKTTESYMTSDSRPASSCESYDWETQERKAIDVRNGAKLVLDSGLAFSFYAIPNSRQFRILAHEAKDDGDTPKILGGGHFEVTTKFTVFTKFNDRLINLECTL